MCLRHDEPHPFTVIITAIIATIITYVITTLLWDFNLLTFSVGRMDAMSLSFAPCWSLVISGFAKVPDDSDTCRGRRRQTDWRRRNPSQPTLLVSHRKDSVVIRLCENRLRAPWEAGGELWDRLVGRTGTAAMLSPGGSCISSASCAVTANSSGGFISVTIHHCTRVHAAPSVGVTNCSYLPRATPTILNEISCAVTLAVLSGTKFLQQWGGSAIDESAFWNVPWGKEDENGWLEPRVARFTNPHLFSSHPLRHLPRCFESRKIWFKIKIETILGLWSRLFRFMENPLRLKPLRGVDSSYIYSTFIFLHGISSLVALGFLHRRWCEEAETKGYSVTH